MIRNVMFGLSLVTLSASAFAGTPVAHHSSKAKVVAQAPATEGAAPATDKPVKKSTKKATAPKAKSPKGEVKGDAVKADAKMESKGEIAPAPAAK